MSGYTPSEEEVRDAWRVYMTEPSEYWDALDDTEADARFDRFLADDRRKTAARALRDAADDWHLENTGTSPRMHSWLNARADRIEKGASDDQS